VEIRSCALALTNGIRRGDLASTETCFECSNPRSLRIPADPGSALCLSAETVYVSESPLKRRAVAPCGRETIDGGSFAAGPPSAVAAPGTCPSRCRRRTPRPIVAMAPAWRPLAEHVERRMHGSLQKYSGGMGSRNPCRRAGAVRGAAATLRVRMRGRVGLAETTSGTYRRGDDRFRGARLARFAGGDSCSRVASAIQIERSTSSALIVLGMDSLGTIGDLNRRGLRYVAVTLSEYE
jgi:hypothetical protein